MDDERLMNQISPYFNRTSTIPKEPPSSPTTDTMSDSLFIQEGYSVVKKELPHHIDRAERRQWITNRIIRMTDESPASVRQLLFQSCNMGIHPLFAPDGLENLNCVEDYISLSPALVLATLVLTCKRSMRFWHLFLYGANQKVTRFSRDISPEYIMGDSDDEDKLSPAESERVKIALHSMIRWMYMEVGRLPFTRFASCCKSESHPNPALTGSKRKIVINNLLSNHRALNGRDETAVFKEWFRLGIALVQAFAHVLHNATYGDDESELQFEDQGYRDMGKAWGEWLFGVKDYEKTVSSENIKGFFDWKSWEGDM